MQHPQCAALWARAEHVLGGGPATLSKLPQRYAYGVSPMLLTAGDGAYVTCPDGQRYVDCVAALGPVLLGHNHPAVTEAVWSQSELLACSTLSTPLEIEVAELLCAMIPGAEMVRFASNGADVCNAAVKVARYVTGKRHIVFTGYHGGHDSYLATTDKRGGLLAELVPYNHQIPFGDWPALGTLLDRIGGHLAAVMVEVPPVAWGQDPQQVTESLLTYRALARDCGALFLVDEVVTGFRYALGGAQAYYGVQGDLSCWSKGLANGYPCAALTGPRDLMRVFDGGAIFLSTTFGAQPVGLAAAKATLTTLRETDALAQLHRHGQALGEAVQRSLAQWSLPATLRGTGARFVVDWQGVPGVATLAELRTLWLQELVTHGVLAGVPWLPMAAYTDALVTAVHQAVQAACEVIADVGVAGRTLIADALHVPTITDVFEGRYELHEESSCAS